MKVPADLIYMPSEPRRPRTGLRFAHTDHPVYSEPSPYDTKWPALRINPNGQIQDLAGWAELTNTASYRWAFLGAGAGFLMGRGLLNIALGATMGFFLGEKIQNGINRVIAAGKVVETVTGK